MNKQTNSHLSEKQLLLYLDSELNSDERERMRSHLESCWGCQTQLDDLQALIGEIVHFQNDVLLPSVPQPPNPWKGLDPGMEELEGRMKRKSPLAFLRDLVRAVPLAPRFGIVAAAAILVLLFLVLPPRQGIVSAAELLIRSRAAQSNEISRVAAPVVHQKLRIRRKEISTNQESISDYEFWSDRSQSRIHLASSQPAAVDELKQLYVDNRFDWLMPLSAAGFEQWRDSLPAKEDQVEGQSGILTLTTTATGGATGTQVEKAQLAVRASDWHPIEQRLWTKEQEYEIAELQSEVLPLASVASLFVTPVVALPSVATTARPSEAIASPMGPSPAESAEAEVDARVALHQVGADLGEPIEVDQTPSGQVEVRGLAASESRKLELIQALQDLPHIAVNIQTVEEAAKSTQPIGIPSLDDQSAHGGSKKNSVAPQTFKPNSRETEVVVARLPIQSHLENYFAALQRQKPVSEEGAMSDNPAIQKSIEDLCNKAVKSSDGALSEAWALLRLAKRYPAEEISKLPPPARVKLETMIRDHVKALRDRINNEQLLLAPVLNSIAGNITGQPNPVLAGKTATNPADFNWPGFPWPLFDEVNQMDRFINGLFAAAGLPLEDEHPSSGGGPLRIRSPERCASDLLASLNQMEAQLPRIENQINGSFLTNQ